MQAAPPKDPDAILDYTRDWSSWLQAGESLATSEWIITSDSETGDDITLEEGADDYESTNNATSATIWLSGGTADVTYLVTNRITTDSTPPRVEDRSFTICIADH